MKRGAESSGEYTSVSKWLKASPFVAPLSRLFIKMDTAETLDDLPTVDHAAQECECNL
ncbi:hypothetical protein K0M31_018182 [Melipona bicolor]|uniref:Uncharacterized protein n=1 Tax=Melipona bicolor TaxID=60889 RepID=A0AA40FCW8_9HYME|nr:hypothetical protein K0M31_018182 [Melipona bicolor]